MVFLIQDEFRILCLGLSGSGKTTILDAITGHTVPITTDEPTSGFNIKTLPLTSLKCDSNLKGKSISFKELGGSKDVQQFWCNYFTNKNGVLFLINAVADETEFEASKEVLKQVLRDPELQGKPCLILGTHYDIQGAREASTIEREFAPIVGKRKWAIRVCCSFNAEQVKSALEVLIDLILDKDGRG